MQGDHDALGIELADQAIAVSEACGDDQGVTKGLILKGSIGHSSVDRSAISFVEEGLRRATMGGHRFDEVYALINLGGLAADVRDMERAVDFTERARSTAARYEMRALEAYATAMYAELMLWRGDWASAENAAGEVLESQPHTELIGWRILGTLQARRGSPGARGTLDRMWALAEPSGELQNIDPAAATLAEYQWLTGEPDETLTATIEAAVERGRASGFVWPSGALAFWAWKLGIMATVPDRVSDFYRWIIEGEWERAAEFWEQRGVPYERGLALMHGDDSARIEALRVFEELGAAATARRVRRDLIERGVNVPRGRSQATREHAAGLTARQAEVLDLLAERLTNAEIADQLFLSPRTVENHVAAILMKLEASSREDAVDRARSQNVLGEASEDSAS
jgi:DNA-binding CsgD family transcriptional regulator